MQESEQITRDELQRQRAVHVPIVAVADTPEIYVVGEVDRQYRRDDVCEECYGSTHNVAFAAWPCLAYRLLLREQELAELARDLYHHTFGIYRPHDAKDRMRQLGLD